MEKTHPQSLASTSVGGSCGSGDLKEPLLSVDHNPDLEHQKSEEDNQRLRSFYGYSLMMMFVVANSMGDSVCKLLYLNHSDLGVIEMMFMRGVICIGLMAVLVGRNCKQILWDSIPRQMVFPLFIRVNSGLLAFFCINYAIKFLPIVLVALFTNTLPLFCSLLGCLILGERITKSEVVCLILAFFGIYVLLYNGRSN